MKTKILTFEKAKKAAFAFAAAGLWASAMTASAAIPVTFTASGMDTQKGTSLAASAVFDVDGNGDLVVTLTDTYTGDTTYQADVLTALFFSGADGLTPVSAAAGMGSKYWTAGNPTPASTQPGSWTPLGEQWEYLSGISSKAPRSANDGISSTGLNIFGHGNFASPGQSVDGTSYGLVSSGYSGSGNDGLNGNYYLENSMMFVLSGFSAKGYTLSGISNVVFQYGSSLSEPQLIGTPVPIPEPHYGVAASMAVLSFLGWGWLRRKPANGRLELWLA